MESLELKNPKANDKLNEIISESTKDGEENTIYFVVLIPKEIETENKKEESPIELNFITDVVPEIIYEKEISKEDGTTLIHRIFKFKMKKEEIDLAEKGKKNSYTFKYIIGNDVYTISFSAKKNYFIYDIYFIKEDYYIDNIVPLDISQKIIPLYNKLEIFLEALQKNNELNKIEKLYEEAIDLYKSEKKFNLLIFLFLRIYVDKNLCSKLFSKLLATFKEIKGIENPNVDANLLRYLDTFNQIFSNKEFIKNNEYETIYYGIIICYLYYYDTNDNYFSKNIKELYKENNKVLFEILIMFHSYFKKPLNQDLNFYTNFIEYTIDNNDMKTFKKALDYIKDIETFVYVINTHKEKIVTNYPDLEPINIKPELKLIKKKNEKGKKNELANIISLIQKIFDYSKVNNKLLLNMTIEFWSNLINHYYSKADLENIDNCHKLRKLFKSYRALIKIIIEESNKNHSKDKDNKKEKNIANEEKKSDKNGKHKDKKNKDKDGTKDSEVDKSKNKKDKNKDKDEKKSDKKDKKKDNEDNYLEPIMKETETYYKRDEFTFVLNRNIKDLISKNDLPNSKKLGIIKKYNPYFDKDDVDDEKKFIHNRDVTILDCIDFDKIDEGFIDSFHKLEFEKIFRKNISEFLNRIVSKIKSIANFGRVLELIDINSIEEESIKEYYCLLKNKYEACVKTEIESIKDKKELNQAVKILAEFVSKIYLFEKNIEFLEDRISQLNKDIKSLIYNELMKTYKGKEYDVMKEYIYKLFLKKLDDIENIIKLIDSLNPEDKKKFLEELVKKCKFKREQFYSNNENKNIKLLYDLNEKGKLDKKCCKEIIGVLDDIYKDLEGNLFTKKELEKFLGKDENSEKIIKKLGLIKIVINEYDPKDKYEKLNNKIKEMNNTIKELLEIKNSFSIFHNSTKKALIDKIIGIIKDIEKSPIYEYDNKKMQDSIKEILDNKQFSQDINNVKNLFIFRIIFDITPDQGKEKRFYNARKTLNEIKQLFQENNKIEDIYKQNEKIFNKIKDELSKKEESKSKEFIDQTIKNLEIPEKYQEDLEIIFKSKKYEMDIKSIKYFFDIFSKKTFESLKDPQIYFSTKKSLDELKNWLKDLKSKEIYDYKCHQKYYDIFTSFYEKKEAIDFLLEKINVDIDYLKKRIDPTKRRLTIKNIEDTIECLKGLKKIVNKDNNEMLNEIKKLDEKKFVSYSKIYEAIIELDRNDDDNDDENIFKNVDKIITKACFIFKQDEEDFFYKENDKNISINLEELVHIKNQISIQPKNNNSKGELDDKDKKEDKKGEDSFEEKCDKLIFFKKLVNNLESIYEKMDILRIKGCNLPILINIKVEYPNISYRLKDEEMEFNGIRQFLLKAKIDYEKQLNKLYKTEKYSRFSYGKIFRKIQRHLDYGLDIDEILRYILNITDNNKKIEDGKIYNESGPKDWANYYPEYNEKKFDNISKYIISLFQKNENQDIDNHYKKMVIKKKEKKGIFLQKIENISKEEYILYQFLDELEQLPIAQNLLICSKETSIEEMQSFLYRAILCDKNTLFVVEMVESFNDYQFNKLLTFIDKLLSIKFLKKENEEKILDKLNTKEYLDSCIFFIYDDKLNNNLKELEKYTNKNYDKTYSFSKVNDLNSEQNENINNQDGKILKKKNAFYQGKNFNESFKERTSNITDSPLNLSINSSGINNFSSQELEKIKENIKIISSDVCGLGKSKKIKKMITNSKNDYYHLPLGGELSKKIIYDKIAELFKLIKNKEKIKNEEQIKKDKTKIDIIRKPSLNIDYSKISVHIDLAESEEIPVINEFLFSFLITKFYTYKEDIIYIPKNLKIYIEIPNCSKDYLSELKILNVFGIENIVLGEVKLNENKNMTNIPMDNLELDELDDKTRDARDVFGVMTGNYENDKIQEYIKANIGLKYYSYHQIEIFIKLFISQYSKLKGNINSLDSNQKEKIKKCFNETSKLFTNGGFSELLIQKKSKSNKRFDLYYKAYDNDLKNKEIKTPIFYIDEKSKKPNLLFLGEEPFDEKKEKERIKNKIKKSVDIVYLIDATGSMGSEINAANQKVESILEELENKFKNLNLSFNFGAVFYRDRIDCKDDINEYIPLTDNIVKLKQFISKIKAKGGGDTPEDWVEGYNLALNKMNWRNGIKLIIHIADAGAHGKEFSKNDKYDKEGPKLKEHIKKCVENNINIVGFKISDVPEQSFDKIKEIYNEYKLSKDIDMGQFIEIYKFNREKALDDFYDLVLEATSEVVNPSFKYLKRLKQMLNLPNEIEENKTDQIVSNKNKTPNKKTELLSLTEILKKDSDNYVITEDNYKKMVLLIYRIQADVPVIIMGETGCGKTSLITKLSQLLNNGKKMVHIIKIHPGINDEDISKEMIKANKLAKNVNAEYWVFFDEINTCFSLTLLTEIFINRTFKGEKLEKNIRLIGACNPYRPKVEQSQEIGLKIADDINEKDFNKEDINEEDFNKEESLVYKVQPLPESLLYYVYSFGPLSNEDEKKYIYSITANKLFNNEEKEIHKLTAEAISQCHIFLRDTFKDPSIVSLREITRFTKCVEFFEDYFLKKNDTKKSDISYEKSQVYRIKSIICSLYLCYYKRLIDNEQRSQFDYNLQNILYEIINVYSEDKLGVNSEKDLLSNIKYEPLRQDIREINMNIKHFSDFLELEEDYLIDQIDLGPGIGKNQLLKENLFLLFLSVCTKIPLIIVGKPGTGKSLSSKLITNSMRGKYSKNPFFRKYPQIIQIYFQGSKSNIPEDVEKLFKRAEKLYKNFKLKNIDKKGDDVPIYMILFDELGLSEKSPKNPLKVLHHKLEYEGKTEGVCFIGISNYSLDAAKSNRALYLSVPNLEDNIDEVNNTAKSIVNNISPELNVYNDKTNSLIFELISRAFCDYKKFLKKIKKFMVIKKFLNLKKKQFENKSLKEIEDDPYFKELLMKEDKIKYEFHGNRDFYSIIKSVALEGSKLPNITDEKQIVDKVEAYIERNFGGITFEIDVDDNFELEKESKDELIKGIKQVLGEKIKPKKKNDTSQSNIIEVSSVYIFKHIYNLVCEDKAKNYKIQKKITDNYDLNKCINENISDVNSRYLMLEIESNLSSLIIENIKMQNPEKNESDKIKSLNGSTFPDDNNNNDYKFGKINEIQDLAAEPERIVILQNLNNIQPYLYDMYNMNYKIIDERKYVRICLENFSEQDTPVSESFRVIILVDRNFINSVDTAFLNRLEKIQIYFRDLLTDDQKLEIRKILKKIELIETVKKKKTTYKLENLLINCSEEDIGGLVYSSFIENIKGKKSLEDIEDKIYTKISYILPQDIIAILSDKNIIKLKYYNKNYYNFKSYVDDVEANINNYKISIIYTFSNIANLIDGYYNDKKFMISELRSENQLKNKIDEMKINEFNEEQNNKIIIIHFEQINSDKIDFVTSFINNYYKNDGYKYIFLIHISRRFNSDSSKERIYSIPNINNDINQIFIDNLNGPSGINLRNILTKNIRDIMFESGTSMDEEAEFKKSLINFVSKAISKKEQTRLLDNLNEEEYINELLNFMEHNKDFKKSLITKAKELIDEDKKAKGDCGKLIEKMFNENYINKNSIDLISCIIDYIKDNIYNKNLEKIFTYLEHHNFLTTLLEIDKDFNNKNGIDKGIIREIKDKILSEMKNEEEKLEPKFLSGYSIPGFLIFYCNLSDFLNKNFTAKFLKNEKTLRKYSGSKPDNKISDFHDEEESILSEVLEEINNKYKNTFQFYFDLINRISPDLVLKDYIIFYLDKYKDEEPYCKSCVKIIKLLLKLRFSSKKNQIIKDNKTNSINILLIKILWIESNLNYIKKILSVFEYAKNIINHDTDGNIMYKMIEDSIYDENISIKYIVDPNRNPEHLMEVNECFYILLTSICLSIISEDIKLTDSNNHLQNYNNNEVDIANYYDQLKEINNILNNLINELRIYLKELFIIDELFKIIDCQSFSAKAIEELRKYLRKSSLIIQNNNNIALSENLKNLLILLKNEMNTGNKSYIDLLKYIFLKEIKKVNDINYHANILDALIKEKDILKKSNDILQILLTSCFKEFKHIQKNLLESKDITLKILDKNLSNKKQANYFTLSETLLYFFEKNSLIYLYDNYKSLEETPTDIFKDCFKYLNEDFENAEKYRDKLIRIYKIFCLGYIKSFCYIFIKMHEKTEFKPNKIIEVINKYDKYNIIKMIKLYLYKIIYYQNNKQIDIFLKHDIKEKYKLSKYNNFKKFVKFKSEDQPNYWADILDDDNYKNTYDIIIKYKNEGYKKEIIEEDIIAIKKKEEEEDSENHLSYDTFYLIAYNLILSQLNKNDFDTEIYNNFYKNICEPVFKYGKTENKKLIELVRILFDPEKYSKFKSDYNIEPIYIDSLLYGFRYCLNELAEEYEGDYIYSSLYNINKIEYLKTRFYPGSDTKEKLYYDLYYNIENHFKQKPNEGCYVCLCDQNQGYYHSIPLGFPGQTENGEKCPYCNKEIGSKEEYLEVKDLKDKDENKMLLVYEPIKRENYFRIFYDDDEIETLDRKSDKRRLLEKINKMTRVEFKQKYIEPLYKKENGLNQIDENKFKKENKIIRNLSQLSYRLLNYILYSHLFFAQIITNSKEFEKYLPNGLTWFETIKECFILLKKELEKEGIKKTEIFMNVCFKELFFKLHEKQSIVKYVDLIDFEEDLEKIIQKKKKKTKEVINKLEEIEKENCKDKTSAVALLKELYNKDDYDPKEYPYYEYFYYSDYPDENYIKDILAHKDKNEYLILIKYLEYKTHSKKEKEHDFYSPDNLINFNKVINLFNEQYSHEITRDKAETSVILESEIYQQNTESINDFIKFYNKYDSKYKDLNANKNYLSDCFLDENNKYGKTYIKLYEKFAKKQNEKLEEILNIKSKQGKYNINSIMKINIQAIKEDEIFTYRAFKNIKFIEVMFNSSYRRIIDTLKYENYNEFEIFLDLFEKELTDSLLENKKLLNCELIEFKYKGEEFTNQINDVITNFEKKYNFQEIDDNDKLIIYDYVITYNGNNNKYKSLINDFVLLIEYLTKNKNDNNDKNEIIKIDENTKIYDVLLNLKGISNDFINIFKNKNDLIVKKVSKIYDYYLKLIFKYVKKEIEKYQDKKEIEEEKEEKNNKEKTNKDKKDEKPKFNLDDKTIKKLNDYFSNEDLTITKEYLLEALRLFMTIILYREEDKENKIKLNKNNIAGYLKEQDLWENNNLKIRDEKFIYNLSKIKKMNIKIKEILWLYNYLLDNEEEDLEGDIKEKYKKYLANLRKQEKEIKIKKTDDKNNASKNSSKSSSKSSSRNSSKSSSRNSSKSKSRNSSKSKSRNSSKSSSRNSSKSNSRNSSKSNSRNSSKSKSRNSSKSNSRNSSKSNSRNSSRKSSVSN